MLWIQKYLKIHYREYSFNSFSSFYYYHTQLISFKLLWMLELENIIQIYLLSICLRNLEFFYYEIIIQFLRVSSSTHETHHPDIIKHYYFRLRLIREK